MLYWFPKIKKLKVPYPKTVIVKCEGIHDFIKFIYNPKLFPEKLLNQLKAKAKEIGYPLFLRTDHISGKHHWNKTCFVRREEDLKSHIIQLIETSELASILGLPINAFVFREFIELDWKFKAFEGMPVAPERRYFIKDGKVICHHPYWVENSIKFWVRNYKPPENWVELLREINTETEDEITLLSKYSIAIGKVLKGYWSVDFAYAKDGTWYLIDMATGEKSWHPEDCPNVKTYHKDLRVEFDFKNELTKVSTSARPTME